MNKQQSEMLDELVGEMFGELIEVGNQVMDMASITNGWQISRDGSFVQDVKRGEIFYPATYKGELVFVLPFMKGGKPKIVWAKNLVWKAFSDPQYLKDLDKEYPSYTLKYSDGDKGNPSYDNLEVVFDYE